MQLSAPIYALKRHAKLLARETNIALHEALDKTAAVEGFQSWGHLVSSKTRTAPVRRVLSQLRHGDLVLLGARPGHGKTLLGLDLATQAAQLGRQAYFFTLDYHARDVAEALSVLGVTQGSGQTPVTIDTSDDICASHIMERVGRGEAPALIVIDYLQLLDQKRINPSLKDQIQSLKDFAMRSGTICAIISQIDRSFDMSEKPIPDMSDIRLPNPLDLGLFTKFFFLHNGRIQMNPAV